MRQIFSQDSLVLVQSQLSADHAVPQPTYSEACNAVHQHQYVDGIQGELVQGQLGAVHATPQPTYSNAHNTVHQLQYVVGIQGEPVQSQPEVVHAVPQPTYVGGTHESYTDRSVESVREGGKKYIASCTVQNSCSSGDITGFKE